MVTVAIPVFNGIRWLPGVIAAVRAQQLDDEVELLACDSGSTDGSRDLLQRAGARVIDLPPGSYSHSGARNRLMAEARGEFVAMLTQDAEPVDRRWLARLLGGFDLGDDVALVYGPYVPRPAGSAREGARLQRFFSGLSPEGAPRIDRLAPARRQAPAIELIGAVGYFTDANGCIRRSAWERVPYPEVPYAEDHALAVNMLRAGFAKVFLPDAGVLHSHDYSPLAQLQRTFDDWRGLQEIYGWREPVTAGHILLQLRGAAGAARRARRAAGRPRRGDPLALLIAAAEQLVRVTGAILGSRSDRLPPWARRRLSLEGRAGFCPLHAAPPPDDITGAGTPAPDAPPHTPAAPAGDRSASR